MAELGEWLANKLGCQVHNLHPLKGGYWSSAFAFRADGDDLVIRFNPDPTGFEIDAKAMQFERLPIPKILSIGQGLGYHYAISQRSFGTFLELCENNPFKIAKKLITGLAAQTTPILSNVNWFEEDQTRSYPWRSWLLESLESAQASVIVDPARTIFEECRTTIERLADEIPERRDLVHGDLLHQNVLVTSSGDIAAIFSWKCSALGDFLFDIAWLDIWAPWHPALENTLFGLDLAREAGLAKEALDHAQMRHFLYTLQIGAHHLGWFSTINDKSSLARMTSYLKHTLNKGPPNSTGGSS